MNFLYPVLLALCIVESLLPIGANALDISRLSAAEAAAEYKRLSPNVTNRYFSNEGIGLFLHGLAEAHPDLVSVFSIGESVSGDPLLAVDVGTSAGEMCVSRSLLV